MLVSKNMGSLPAMDEREIRKREILRKTMELDLFKEAIQDAKRNIITHSMSTAPSEDKVREQLYYECRAIDRVAGKLLSYVNEIVMMEKNNAA
jgi:hypothetical protein